MVKYNLLTCAGFGNNGWFGSGTCIKARLGVVILFFLLALANKWIFQMMGLAFNVWIGTAAGVISYVVIIGIFGSFKLAFFLGLVIAVLTGLFGAGVFGASGDGE